MKHDEYWKKVGEDAIDRLHRLFRDCVKDVEDIVGDENGIDSYEDAKCVLAYALSRAENCEERACAIISATEALHAQREIEANLSQAGA